MAHLFLSRQVACDLRTTILGYAPNKAVNIFLSAAFALAGIVCLGFGFAKHTRVYGTVLALGCLLEGAGYVGRVLMNNDPCSMGDFNLQIVAIIIAPALIAAALYLLLKHFTRALNHELSRVRPNLYPFLFVPADITCLALQGVGGGIASGGDNDPSKASQVRTGNHLIIAGICMQVIVLAVFGAVVVDYVWRLRKWMRGEDGAGAGQLRRRAGADAGTGPDQKEAPTTESSLTGNDPTTLATARGPDVQVARALWADKKFKLWLYAMVSAYSGILIRCIYRIAEMAGGWGSTIMQDEPSFVVLESFAILVSCILFAAFPPGVFFPQMSRVYLAPQA